MKYLKTDKQNTECGDQRKEKGTIGSGVTGIKLPLCKVNELCRPTVQHNHACSLQCKIAHLNSF